MGDAGTPWRCNRRRRVTPPLGPRTGPQRSRARSPPNSLQAIERELTTTLTDRARHERDLGANPAEARTERDAVKQALTRLTREQRTLEAQTPTKRHHDRTLTTERDTTLDLRL